MGFVKNFGGKSYQALGGNLTTSSLVIYRLDGTGTVPIEPLLDLTVGKTINRITADLIESENYTQSYGVTQNSLSNNALVTSHVNKNLKTLSISAFFVSNPVTGATAVFNPLVAVLTPFSRVDRTRVNAIQALADQGIPVGVYTPRWALPQAFITGISAPWDPEVSENTRLSLEFLEARIVAPQTGAYVNDYSAQMPGNNNTTGGGQSSVSKANPPSLYQPESFGSAPSASPLIPL